jgi:hypothetical protein
VYNTDDCVEFLREQVIIKQRDADDHTYLSWACETQGDMVGCEVHKQLSNNYQRQLKQLEITIKILEEL